ncbi:MAG: type II toxin-antitoxin system VapC family toxin [Propionibacteriaceae bacterium]|nr:type II toxin-antitoxin system VapC family toxin [Propionibacteriaceae bacterium]
MKTLLDTNVIVRHLTQDPADLGQAATKFLASADDLVLTDVIAAETVYVLQSFYRTTRPVIAAAMRALIAMKSVTVEHEGILLHCLELYETKRIDFADAYLGAYGEAKNINTVASFDKDLNKCRTITRLDPANQDTQ